jgi:hypothetical protein
MELGTQALAVRPASLVEDGAPEVSEVFPGLPLHLDQRLPALLGVKEGVDLQAGDDDVLVCVEEGRLAVAFGAQDDRLLELRAPVVVDGGAPGAGENKNMVPPPRPRPPGLQAKSFHSHPRG